MKENQLPKVSIIMPVLNAEKMLEKSLPRIRELDYPRDLLEIVIADGGSVDNSVEVAKKYDARVFSNPLKTSESGKAVGVNNSTGELILLIDSDNLIIEKDWLKKMVAPLVKDPDLLGSECLYFTHRKEDGFIDRYCALIGMNDPICIWLGSYDRYNYLTGKWNGLGIKEEDKGGYIELLLEDSKIPTIGANGCVFRKRIFDEVPDLYDEYLFDMDILQKYVQQKGTQKFAKVKVGIVHLYCGTDLTKFKRKQLRRVKDFLYRRKLTDLLQDKDNSERIYTYGHENSKSLFISVGKFVFSCITVIPLIYQAIKGYVRKKDLAWFSHPLMCWITLLVYTYGTLESFVNPGELDRDGWK